MAAQTLFDLSAIDLTQVAVTPDDVAGMNPQTGHMRHLDYVIWKSEDSTSGLGVKAVRGDEFGAMSSGSTGTSPADRSCRASS